MAQPIPYQRSFDFTNLAVPVLPEAGTRNNAEFDNVATSITSVRGNLARIQRDDGRLVNASVSLETMDPRARLLMGGWTPRGQWVAGTSYAVRDFVSGPDGAPYVAGAAHTSGTFSSDVAAARWTPLFGSAAELSSLVQIIADGSTAARSLGDRFGEVANVADFGAIGDGVTDDTSALEAALATGKPVEIPAGFTCKITRGLVISTNGQVLRGENPLSSILEPVGSFNVITFAGNVDRPMVEKLTINAGGMTGGYVFNASGADRVICQYLQINSPYHIAYCRNNNLAVFFEINANFIRGTYGFHAEGIASVDTKAAVLRIQNVQLGNGLDSRTYTGLYIDGFVNTIQIYSFACTAPYRGIFVGNSSGDPANRCNFIESFDFESDFAAQDGIYLEAISGANFVTTYVNGASSLGNGVYIGPGAEDVNFINPFIRGCVTNGVIVDGKDITFAGGEVVFNNSSAPFGVYSGVVVGANARRVAFSGVLSGNKEGVGATQAYGLYVDAGAQDISWTGGSLVGNMIAPYRDDSASTTPGNVQVVGAAGTGESLFSNAILGTKAGRRALIDANVLAGSIASYTVVDGGEGYTQAPSGFLYDPTGSGATITIQVANGVVTGATGGGGSGYSDSPLVQIASFATEPTLRPRWHGLPNSGIVLSGAGSGAATLRNDQGVGFMAVAPAGSVNFLTVTGASTGNGPAIYAAGPDANLSMGYTAKGSGVHSFGNGQGIAFQAFNVPSSVNGVAAIGAGAGGSATLRAVGEANAGISLQASGTGWVAIAEPGQALGFFGATPGARPDVGGSRATGDALTNLLGALSTMGLINNVTAA